MASRQKADWYRCEDCLNACVKAGELVVCRFGYFNEPIPLVEMETTVRKCKRYEDAA